MILKSHMRTHASNQTILGVEFFEIDYPPVIQHIFPLILSCRNMTLRSKNTVLERDTPIRKYHVRTWHSDPKISCRNVTLRSNNTINLSFNITTFSFINNISSSLLYSRHYFDRDGLRLYISRSRDFRPITKHTTKPHNHTIKYIENFTISFNAYKSLLRVYYQIA